MAHFPRAHRSVRAPRTTFPNPEPANFRVDNQLVKGAIRRLSMTGGCAVLNNKVKTGTLAEIAIPTPFGVVCGLIEFLANGAAAKPSPEFGFRFVAFNEQDHERLSKALHQFG